MNVSLHISSKIKQHPNSSPAQLSTCEAWERHVQRKTYLLARHTLLKTELLHFITFMIRKVIDPNFKLTQLNLLESHGVLIKMQIQSAKCAEWVNYYLMRPDPDHLRVFLLDILQIQYAKVEFSKKKKKLILINCCSCFPRRRQGSRVFTE